MTFDLEALWSQYGEKLVAGALNVLAAAAILIVGLYVAAWAGRAMRRFAAKHPRIDETLAAFCAWIVRYALTGFVLIAVLNRFGVATTSVVAVLGAATLAIGLALQGTLSNLAAGVMLILFRPYRLGDYVEMSGQAGTVVDVTLFTTELKTPQNAKVVLPNGVCWGAPIVNFTAYPYRRIDLEFGVAYDTDLDHAIAVLEQVLEQAPKVLPDPAPAVQVSRLDASAVVLWARAWVRAADFLETKLALIKAGKEALDAEGVSIPFPTNINYEIRMPPPRNAHQPRGRDAAPDEPKVNE